TLGIPVSLNYYSADALFGNYTSGGILARGQYDLSVFYYLFGVDPDGNLYPIFHSTEIPSATYPGGGNWERVNDPNIDSLLDRGRVTLNVDTRTQLYKDIQRALVDQVIVVPLYLVPNLVMVQSTIGNEQDNPTSSGNLWNVGDWFLS